MTTELAKWLDGAEVTKEGDLKVPPNIIRAMLAKSVVDNWPGHEVAYDAEGNPVMLRSGNPTAANKALEMLAKDSGMLDDRVDVSGTIDIRINGVDTSALQ